MHPPHPQVPQCTSCGLILCALLAPSPLLPSAHCPSCAAVLLQPGARAALLDSIAATRAELEEQQRAAALRLRAERQAAKEARARGESTRVELFPELVPQQQQQAGRAREQQMESQRKARVLTLDAKTHKLRAPKPKKKTAKPAAAAAEPQVARAAAAPANVPAAAQEESEEEDQEDYDAQGLGIVPDPDDDGFAMHQAVGAPDELMRPSESGWWGQPLSLGDEDAAVAYVPKEQRPQRSAPQTEVDEEPEKGKGKQAERAVPGAQVAEKKSRRGKKAPADGSAQAT